MNKDAVECGANQRIGIGIIVRNHDGLVMGFFTRIVSALFSPQIEEAAAMLRGIKFAIDTELLPAVIESDVKSVVDLVRFGTIPYADVGVVIVDILSLLNCFVFLLLFLGKQTRLCIV